MIIESVKDLDPLNNVNDWEKFIPNEFYKFVYFDGLNNFYLNFEHLDLKKHFNRFSVLVPGFVRASEFELTQKLNKDISNLTIKISQLETRVSWLQSEKKSQELFETLYHMQERIEYLSQIQSKILEERDSLYLELSKAVELRDIYFIRLTEIYGRKIWKFVNPFLRAWRQILRVKYALANPGKILVFLDAKLRRFPNFRRIAIKFLFKFTFIENRLAIFRSERNIRIPKVYTEGIDRYSDLNFSSQIEYFLKNY